MGGSSSPGAATVYGNQGVAASAIGPGARDSGSAWADQFGNLWLFGGQSTNNGTSVYYGDLWSYSTSSNEWTFEALPTTTNAAATYGTIGVPANSNLPGGRAEAAAWIDGFGNPWFFGGVTLNSAYFNDLWQYIAE